MNEAYGTSLEREMEQFEIIDIAPDEFLRQKWNGFIHTHHYNTTNSYFNSSLAQNPRRTSESFFHHYQPISPGEMFREPNPVPTNFKTLKELQDWHRPLIQAEESASQ